MKETVENRPNPALYVSFSVLEVFPDSSISAYS